MLRDKARAQLSERRGGVGLEFGQVKAIKTTTWSMSAAAVAESRSREHSMVAIQGSVGLLISCDREGVHNKRRRDSLSTYTPSWGVQQTRFRDATAEGAIENAR